MEQITSLLDDCFSGQALVKMVFGNVRKKSLPYKKVTIRPVILKEQLCYQAEYHYDKKAVHENLNREEAAAAAVDFVLRDFKQINIFTETEEIQVMAAKPNSPKIIRRKSTNQAADLQHNRNKQYLIPDKVPCDFLVRLGVMDQKGTVAQKHYSKFRQINRFLEITEDIFSHLPRGERPLRIIDFGCGKAYLTFALYYYLKEVQGRDVEIVGLDLKEDVIAFCNQVAEDLHYSGLRFLTGDIADYSSDYADMVVTLHACDTATDFALINGVKWDASVILSVPCCQHELFSQIHNDLHGPMFKHGILKDRFTELLTDGLRGLKLESKGYDVAMIEFTSLEHTSKNIMIKAVKTKKANESALAEYERLKNYYHVTPAIDKMK